MFGISFGELIVIMVIALIVIGPERLPTVVRTLGRWVGKLRGYTNTFRSDIEREFRLGDLQEDLNRFKQQNDLDALRRSLRETTEKGNNYLKETESSLQQSVNKLESSLHPTVESDPEALEDMAFDEHHNISQSADASQNGAGLEALHDSYNAHDQVLTEPPAGFNPSYHASHDADDELLYGSGSTDGTTPFWIERVRARQLAIVMEDAPYPMYLTYHLNAVRAQRTLLSESQCETLYKQRLIELNRSNSSNQSDISATTGSDNIH